MDTPVKNAPDGHSPISYDIESAGKSKFDSKFLADVAETGKSGDSDINTMPKGYWAINNIISWQIIAYLQNENAHLIIFKQYSGKISPNFILYITFLYLQLILICQIYVKTVFQKSVIFV